MMCAPAWQMEKLPWSPPGEKVARLMHSNVVNRKPSKVEGRREWTALTACCACVTGGRDERELGQDAALPPVLQECGTWG